MCTFRNEQFSLSFLEIVSLGMKRCGPPSYLAELRAGVIYISWYAQNTDLGTGLGETGFTRVKLLWVYFEHPIFPRYGWVTGFFWVIYTKYGRAASG
jgi:hypothetical protein